MLERVGCLILGLFLAISSARPAAGSDFDILVNEVYYSPFSGDDGDEFVELYNRGPAAVDLSFWSFSEGISYTFQPGASIGPHEYLVVSPDQNHAKLRYGILNVVGNYAGKLDNGGEVLTLVDSHGAIMSRVHYLDEGLWPSHPDGLGLSLELMTPHEQNDLPQKWASSLVLEGTPGRQNSRFVSQVPARAIVAQEDRFRAWKGTAEPSSPMTDWTQRGFSDAAWAESAGPFGYGGTYTVKTPLSDMLNGYSTYYLRHVFDLDASTLGQLQSGSLGLTIHLSYDDAFVAYLNGVEVGRANVGTPGTPVPRASGADSSINNGSLSINLAGSTGLLVAAGNVLAIQGVNQTAASTDFFLGAELVLSPGAVGVEEVKRTVVLNEVRPTETPGGNGSIELYNSTAAAVNLGGHLIVDSRGARFQIPNGTSIAAGGFLSFGEGQLGFQPAVVGAAYALVKPDGLTWVDGLRPAFGPPGAAFGRFPDGNEDQYVLVTPTPGAKNQLSLPANVVLNEVLFHPAFVAPSGNCLRRCSDPDQWVEVLNRGAAETDVGGWSLSKAVDFTIPGGTKVPAGGFLVIAADRARFLALHPAADQARVVGGWTRSLGRNSDTLNLRDVLGNRVDHVEYGDGQPFNDESPADGADDRTLASSEWPLVTPGRSLELIHASLDNRAGPAWALGPPGGTPGAQNAALDATPPPVVWEVDDAPAAPRSTEPVRVTCRVSSVGPLTKVEALWHVEPAGAVQTLALHDDGLSGDGAAGDGVYGGQIPTQPNASVVAFQVRAQAEDGQAALVPRQPAVAPYAGFNGPYFLYQVDNAVPPANGSVTYRVVMATADLNELRSRATTSNVLLPCTFIGEGKPYHAVGIRIRGETTRQGTRKPWRIDFPPERGFRGLEHVNLISDDVAPGGIQKEILAADLFRRAGLPYMQEWTVNLVFQGTVDPLYLFKENLDGDFLDRFFGGSGKGNLYRALDPPGGGPQGDLSYQGESPAAYRPIYDKKSNREEDDYSDIIELCRAFDPVLTPDAQFPARLEELIDANEWARFFAVQADLSNNDGGIQSGTGEDYLLYKVPAASARGDAGKWLLIPWDLDETFTDSAERLFRPDIAAIRRFLRHPAFAPLYYANLVDLRNGAFSRFETRQRFYLISSLFGFGTIDGIDSYITRRIGFIDENVPVTLVAGITGAAGSYLVQTGELWRYFKGQSEPSGGNRSWANRVGFSDAAWLEGPTGIGYGDGDDATVLDDMLNGYTTVYARRSFNVADPAAIANMTLSIDYDDGFVAYLNGQEVARRNAPGPVNSFVAFDATASGAHEAGTPETIDLTAERTLLVAGTNVLAIQALNQARDSSDLTMIPELLIGGPAQGAGCGSILYATGGSVTIGGSAGAALTRSVKVNGSAVPYDPFTARWSGPVALSPGENTVQVEAFDAEGAPLDSQTLTIVRLARPFTSVGGTLTGNTSWTSAGGPYLMTQNVVIPAGSKLAIGPGSVIFGQAAASIIVRGVIEAVGTQAEPILFRAYSCQNRMGGIALDSTGIAAASPQHHLQFIDVEFAENPAGFLGTVAPVGSKLLVEDSKFRELTANAIDGMSCFLEVRRSLFERIHEGVHCNSSVVTILDCTFSHMIGDKDAIDFDLNGPGGLRNRIEGCLIEYGSDDGIDLQTTTVDIRNNVIRYIQDKALSLEENGPVGGPSIVGNLIHDCGTAIALKSGVTITEGHHNTVVGNQEGVNLFAKAGAADGGHGIFDSMVIWDNIFNVKLDAKSTVAFTFSDIGEPWSGAGNITAEPRFADELRKDYSLRPGSPAIGTGKNGTDMGAVPFTGQQPVFIRGDANSSGVVDLGDVIFTLEYLFRGAAGPACLDRLDSNDDGGADVSDPVYTLFYKFAGGPAPAAPFPSSGVDPTQDGLACQ